MSFPNPKNPPLVWPPPIAARRPSRTPPPRAPRASPHEIDLSRLEESGPHVAVGPQRKEVAVIPAESLAPRRAKPWRLMLVVLLLWLGAWGRAEWKEMEYRDRAHDAVVESFGNDARQLAERIADMGRRRGFAMSSRNVRVDIGADSALGRAVEIRVTYPRRLLPDGSITVRRRSSFVPLVASRWDGKALETRPGL